MLDSDFDTKLSLMDLLSPKINAFDQPLHTTAKIKSVPEDVKIKIIISTKGGSLPYLDLILRALRNHKSGYDVYVVNCCYSAGGIVALGADDIIMSDSSYIGKIDPQYYDESITNYIDIDEKYISADNITKVIECRKIMAYTYEILENLLKNHMHHDKLQAIKDNFIFSKRPHMKLFDAAECKQIGLNVRKPKPDEMKFLDILNDE